MGRKSVGLTIIEGGWTSMDEGGKGSKSVIDSSIHFFFLLILVIVFRTSFNVWSLLLLVATLQCACALNYNKYK